MDDELIEKAKSKGLNLSGFLESKLREFLAINSPDLRRSSDTLPSNNQVLHIPAFGKHKRQYEKWLISRKLNEGYIKDLVNTLIRFIREDIIELPDDLSEMQSIAIRSYLKYLTEKSLLTEEGAKHFRKKVPLRQSKADN